MNRCLMLLLLVGLAVPLADTLASDAIYKWVDNEGVTHYSPRPPEGVDYERLTAAGGRSSEPASQTIETEPSETPEVGRTERRRSGLDPEELAERCDQARSNLTELHESESIILRDEDGSEQLLDEEGRQRTIEETEAFIAEWC